MPEPLSFVVTERERKILYYLFQTKLATFRQIHSDLFENNVRSVVSERLQRLFKINLIAKGLTNFRGKQVQIFYLNPETVHLLYPEDKNHIRRYQAQSSAAEHDLFLVEIRKRLQGFEPIKKYWMENELQCLKDYSSDPKLLPFIILRSDAILEIISNREQMITPLELEISRKTDNRYIELIKKYYERTNTICILYISGSSTIQKAVMKIERSIHGNEKPKFYYAQLDDVLKPSEIIEFTNLRGDKFVLR